LILTTGIIIFNNQKEEVVLDKNLSQPKKNDFIISEKTEENFPKNTIDLRKEKSPIEEISTNEAKVPKNEITENEIIKDSEIKYTEKQLVETSNNEIVRETYGYKTDKVVSDGIVKSVNPNVKYEEDEEVAKKQDAKKLSPLVVINGEVAKNGKKAMNDVEIESLVELKEPLYIINGIHYSELEMFGPNPTSPYAPLEKQEITSLKILLEEEAVKIYGEKGKKGVVIVSTKNGKPKM
jgi:hypothetical protein